jgi:hypothetical protein
LPYYCIPHNSLKAKPIRTLPPPKVVGFYVTLKF